MKTYVYIDGFNLYYGLYKRKKKWEKYKWLDLKLLFENLLQSHHKIEKIKYFTARVSGKTDPDQPTRQMAYLNALAAYIPEIEIIYGKFLSHDTSMPLSKPQGKKRFVKVIKTEEKGSDVNLAVHLLNDAWKDEFECAIVASNDGDLASPIRIVKKELNKFLGWVVPEGVFLSNELSGNFDFVQKIRLSHLQSSQLPSPIPGTNISKPQKWN